jgi:hypothetical protein
MTQALTRGKRIGDHSTASSLQHSQGFRVRRAATTLAVASLASVLGLVALASPAIAHDCMSYSPGWLCFEDNNILPPYPTGGVEGTNSNWGAFGWDNKADYFRNDGNTHRVCIYNGYGFEGYWFNLAIGASVTYYDRVSSNKWTTTSTSCPIG